MNPKQFLNTVIITFSTEIGIHILSFVTTIIIVRNLSPHDFGVFSLIMSFSLTLCYLTTIGLPQSIIYFIGKKKVDVEKYISTYQVLFFCILLGVLIVTFFLKGFFLKNFLKEIPGHYFILLLGIYSLIMIDASLLSIVRGFNIFFLFNQRRFLTPVLNLMTIAVIYCTIGIKLKYVLLSFLTINLLLTIWFIVKVKSIVIYKFYIDFLTAKSLMKYGFKSYLQNLAGHLIYQVDLYIIAYLLDAREVAHYGVAVGLATILWYIPNTVGIVLFPTLSSKKSEKEIHIFSTNVCRHTLFITSFASIILAFTAKYILIFCYGSQYIASLNAMLLILPGIIAMSVYKVLTRNFSSRNRQQVSIWAASISLILNICLNIIWIPAYGIEGAALASTVSYMIAGSILVIKVKMESNIPISQILFVNIADFKLYGEKFCSIYKKYKITGNKKR